MPENFWNVEAANYSASQFPDLKLEKAGTDCNTSKGGWCEERKVV